MRNDNLDPGFEQYRRERNRRRAQGGPLRPLDSQSPLHELELAEAKEVKDRQLSREVHEFFESATKQAATIVQRVTENAKTETVERVTTEMEEFLLDAFSRMNNFVLQILNSRRGPVAEQQIETHMQNLVGPMLDGFRTAGTAGLSDKHLGQDPFATDPSELVKELQSTGQDDQVKVEPLDSLVAHKPVAFGATPTVDVERHPLAQMHRDEQEDAPAEQTPMELPPAPEPVQRATAATAGPAPGNSQAERFKEALRNLVRQGMMTKDEARVAWQTKRQSFAPK